MIRLAVRLSGLLLLFLAAAAPASACDGRLAEGAWVFGGSACLPAAPQRIVVLDPAYSLGMALDLGLPVIGAPLFGMSDGALRRRAEERGIVDIGVFDAPSLERIVGLRPDLIIGSELASAGATRLASIAPTLLLTAPNWQDYFRDLARATGREAAAEEGLAAYRTRSAAIAQRVPQDFRVSVVRITSWDFQVYLDGPNAYGPFAVLRDAGVRRSLYETTRDETVVKRPDLEDLAALDGDILLYIVGGANNSDRNGRHEEVLANPLWQMLPAVKAGRVHRVDAGTWMEFNGLASANRVLDDIERFVVEAK